MKPVIVKVFYLMFFLILFFQHHEGFSQLYIKDSLIVNFQDSSIAEPVPINVKQIEDVRSYPDYVISITEKKQYKYVPVDYFICLPNPLSEEISSMIIPDNNNTYKYQFVFTEFKAQKRKYFIKPGIYLNSTCQVYSTNENDSLQFVGELLYEEGFQKFSIKTTEKLGYEKVLENWQKHFLSDINTFSTQFENQESISLENYRNTSYTGKPKNMYMSTDAIVGLNFWALEGEIIFSPREVNQFFQRKSYNVRYRNEEELEIIEFDLFNTHINYRLNDRILFNTKGSFMLGLNKWKNLEDDEHELYDIAMLDLSFSQRIMWNPLDKRALVLGFGLFESVNYIYYYNVRFNPGFLISVGVKL